MNLMYQPYVVGNWPSCSFYLWIWLLVGGLHIFVGLCWCWHWHSCLAMCALWYYKHVVDLYGHYILSYWLIRALCTCR